MNLLTSFFFKQYSESHDFKIGKSDFTRKKVIETSDLVATQVHLDGKTIADKLNNKNLSDIYVVEHDNVLYVIDGHHTVAAKKLKGKEKVKVYFLNYNEYESNRS